MKDLSGRDHASHMVKHNIKTSHTDVNTANFKTIDINFSNNKKKRKIAESLWIKDLRPTLNVRKKSIPLIGSIIKQSITHTATSKLCNIGII